MATSTLDTKPVDDQIMETSTLDTKPLDDQQADFRRNNTS